MDVVSIGELERAWLAGTPMADIVFAGVGKTDAELRGALAGRFSPLTGEVAGFPFSERTEHQLAQRGPVGLINVESPSELERLAAIARELMVTARVCVRVNPNVDPRVHEYVTTGKDRNKFGVDVDQIPAMFDHYRGHAAQGAGVELVGLHVHIGSSVRETGPYTEAVKVVLALLDRLAAAGHPISVLDLGGGWGVDYESGESPGTAAYAAAMAPLVAERAARGLKVVVEPGKTIMANAGVLLTRVQHVKQGAARRFVICDAGMQTLIRPALYKAFHFVWPVEIAPEHLPPRRAETLDLPGLVTCDVVGPICESADFLARDRTLPEVGRGDLLAIFSAGAYGMSMTSNYNDHGRPAEVLVDGDRATVIRERQTLAEILAPERRPREL
jgi:diaminopimelate decarboxylase